MTDSIEALEAELSRLKQQRARLKQQRARLCVLLDAFVWVQLALVFVQVVCAALHTSPITLGGAGVALFLFTLVAWAFWVEDES